MAPKPLSQRPVDLVYFVFFVSHLFASLFVDLQSVYPSWVVPDFLKYVVQTYLDITKDPFLGQVIRMDGFLPIEWAWMKTIFMFEAIIQNPLFILGAYATWKDWKKVYPILIAYGASGAATVLPMVIILFQIPDASSNQSSFASKVDQAKREPHISADYNLSLTTFQRITLLGFYLPFFLIPLAITLDYTRRTMKLLGGPGVRDEAKKQGAKLRRRQ